MTPTRKPPEPTGPPDLTVTTIRVTRDQLYWLREEAMRRARARGYGKADASEVVRDLIAASMSSDKRAK